jgi:hypothetical protein
MLLPIMTVRRCRLAVAALLLIGAPAVLAGPGERPMPVAQNSGQLLFETLDNDTQDVNAEEIWRVREASTSDEPPGAIVIDYGFERLFVKDTLDHVVEKIRGQRDLRKFTSPSGAPIYIAPDKVIGINRSLPQQHHANSKSIIIIREGQQQVRETRQAITDALKQ